MCKCIDFFFLVLLKHGFIASPSVQKHKYCTKKDISIYFEAKYRFGNDNG